MINNYYEIIESKNPKGVVVITHGIALYSKYYKEFAKAINKSGYHVLLYDVKGHGRSYGIRGDLDNYEVVVNDLYNIVSFIHNKYELPIYLLGHSMGGLITNLYSTFYQNFDGLIILSTPYKFSFFNKLMIKLLRLFKVKDMKTNYHDKNLSKLEPIDDSDPLLLKSFTFNLVDNLLIKGGNYYLKHYKNNKKPILLIYGDKDKMASYKTANKYLDKMPIKDKRLVLIKNAYHNLHHDVETKEVVNTITNWLNKRTQKE
ncbi:MAG: alpha/beta fold hydrolase [Acholeplasmataceae bacterium]